MLLARSPLGERGSAANPPGRTPQRVKRKGEAVWRLEQRALVVQLSATSTLPASACFRFKRGDADARSGRSALRANLSHRDRSRRRPCPSRAVSLLSVFKLFDAGFAAVNFPPLRAPYSGQGGG